MKTCLMGTKVGMTRVYDEAGVIHPVTVISLGPCQVLQVRTMERDGYHAMQLGYMDKARRKANQAERGHVAKVGAEPKRFIREVRLTEPSEHAEGATLNVDLFNDIKAVDVIGTMKGRGFAGGMKRHGFKGQEVTHGTQRKQRAPGSIGSNTTPGRVKRGLKMNGQYGNTRITVRNLSVVRIDAEAGLMLVRGGVPGPNGGMVMVQQSKKERKG